MAKPKTIPTQLTPQSERSQLEKLLTAAYGKAVIVDDYEVSSFGVFSGEAIEKDDDTITTTFRFDPKTESIEFGGDADEPVEE